MGKHFLSYTKSEAGRVLIATLPYSYCVGRIVGVPCQITEDVPEAPNICIFDREIESLRQAASPLKADMASETDLSPLSPPLRGTVLG